MPRHYAIVPAAGSGSRFGSGTPKQYLDLLGRPLIHHALAALVACPAVDRVWVVLSPEDNEWNRHDWSDLGPKLETLRCGGAAVRTLVLASLGHWAREFGVDGFRFDLASILARRADGTVTP